jgi:hypothetical protein
MNSYKKKRKRDLGIMSNNSRLEQGRAFSRDQPETVGFFSDALP